MQLIRDVLNLNPILTVALLAWFVAQVLKTLINFILLGKFQLERMWGDGGMPSAHSATVCAMVIATARSEGFSSPSSRCTTPWVSAARPANRPRC